MRYLWNMGLSGSIFLLACLCVRLLLRGRLGLKWQYLIGKAILLYYLVPVTFLKGAYEKLLKRWSPRTNPWASADYINSGESLLIIHKDGWTPNSAFRWELALGGIWIAAGLSVFVWMLIRYLREKKKLDRCRLACPAEDRIAFDAIKRAYGIRRQVKYLNSALADREGGTAFTVGILHPIVLYPAGDRDEKNLIVAHELTHIKHHDPTWRMLATCVCILHCVNPLVWYLKRELEQLSEMYCDECILDGRDDETRILYGELLLGMAQAHSRNGWAVALSRKSKKLKERLEMIMNKKTKLWGRTLSVLTVAAAVFLNSFTVLAYRDVQVLRAEEADQNIWGNYLEAGSEQEFLPNTISLENSRFYAELYNLEIHYDIQFIDGDGTICPISEDKEMAAVYASCNHHYIEGTASKHIKNSSGGCTTTLYKAKRCSLCGSVVYGEILEISIKPVCPH